MGTIDTISSSSCVCEEIKKENLLRDLPLGTNMVARIWAMIEQWSERQRSRRVLARLSDRDLADIGISRTQANFEAARPFWDGSADYQ